MGDLAVGLAKTVLEGALSRAKWAIDEEETRLRESTRRDLVFIAGEFEMMLSCLGLADAERVNNSVVRTWLRQVRDLAYDAEDCVDLAVHLDSGTSWWRRRMLLPPCVPAAALRLDAAAAEIERLRARVEDVSRRNSRYSLLISDSGSEPGVQQQLAPRAGISATELGVLGEARDTGKKQWGFEDLTQLIAKDGSDLGVISILGKSDNLGAMSIIRKAYEDPEICQTFGCRGWVKLEHPFSLHNFLQSVVAQFYANSCLQQGTSVDVAELERMERTAKEGGLIEEFWTQVSEQRYLLVVENVCNMGEWDAVRACLPRRDNGGNWIIVSTEQCEIAGLCIGHSYQVLELNQYSADYPVCVFFKQSSQGEIDKAMPSEITKVKRMVYDRVPMTKQDAARTWMEQNTLVGREAQLKSLRDYQTKARFENWRVMSVWGIAGVGKSALVKKFYYGRMLESPSLFAKYSWVNVVHPLNLIDFSLNLLSDFHSESLEAMEIKDPVQQCYKLLKENRFLVVINDLQSKEEWNLIKNVLVKSRDCQSFIIVITTEENIAIYCADNEDIVFNVKGLESEAAFHLFKEKVHRKNPSSPLKDSKSEDIEQLIVKCGGLPKVIVSVADFLAPKTVKSMESTRTINQKFMHELESNQEFDCLRELFDWMHLFFRTCPDFLRPCIFYLSVFPGYQIIRRRRLVMRWVAEGYSRDTKENTAEERAEMLFSMLVNLSMIQPPPCTVITHMRMVQCQVNAFFHEYIISRPEEDNIVFALEVFELQGQCCPSTRRTGRHLVIKSSWDRDRIVFDSIDFSRLRSLTVFGKWESFFISESMKVLRVLDLEDASGVSDKDLEKIVKLLPRLKFLSLRGKREICHLPSLLSELRQLETLDVRGTSIVTLPASITKLMKLQYIRAGTTSLAEEPSTLASASWLPNLRTSHPQVGVEVPSGIDKLTALHTLGIINAGITWGKATMKELKSLTQLRKLGVSGISRKNIKEVSAAISCHVHLESLSLWLSKGNQCCLEDISPPKKLQTLKMYGIVKVVPQWIKDLPKLTKLELGMAISEEFDIIGVLGVIKELSSLRLCVKPLHGDGGRLDFCVWVNGQQQRCYLKLKILEVACTSKLTVAFGSEAMQNLELLTVFCSSASALQVFELNCLSNLKEVRLIGSHDGILKEDLDRQLNEHRGRPTLKLEESCSS